MAQDLFNNFSFSKTLKLKTKQQELLICVTVLTLIYILAFITRLFSVLHYESMIHEFDPYFNYRTTLYLTKNGFTEFWNWFDSERWYPLGRIISGTLYPDLMLTVAALYWVLRFLHFAVHIREVCVLTAPFFGSNTTFVAYFFGKEIWDSGAGIIAANLIAICPGYISRSMARSYDNEGVAIFALLLTFYLFVKAVNTGSLAWALALAFGYFYMVSAWGGYVFIINLVTLYVLVLLVTGVLVLPFCAIDDDEEGEGASVEEEGARVEVEERERESVRERGGEDKVESAT